MVTSWVVGWLAACTGQGPAQQGALAPPPEPPPERSTLDGTTGPVVLRDGVPAGVGRVTCAPLPGPDGAGQLLVDVPIGLGLRRATLRVPAVDGDHALGADTTLSWSDGPTTAPTPATDGVVTVRGRELTVERATVGGQALALRVRCSGEAGPSALTLDGAPVPFAGAADCISRPQLALVAATTLGPLRVSLGGGSVEGPRAVVAPGPVGPTEAAVDLTLATQGAMTALRSAPGGSVSLAAAGEEWVVTLDGVRLAGPDGRPQVLAGAARCPVHPEPAPWTGPAPEAAAAPTVRIDGADQGVGLVRCDASPAGTFDVTVVSTAADGAHVRLSLPVAGWPADGAWLIGGESALLHVSQGGRALMGMGGLAVVRATPEGLLRVSASSVPAEIPSGGVATLDVAVDCLPPVEVRWSTSAGDEASLVGQLPECRRVAGAVQVVASTQWGRAQSVFAAEVPEAPAQPTSWPLSDAIAPGTAHAGLQEHPLPQGSGDVRAWFSTPGAGQATASVDARGVLTVEVTGATLAPLGEGAPLPFTGRLACRLPADQRP